MTPDATPITTPITLTDPPKLAYASPTGRQQPSARLVSMFTAVSVIAVLASGSVAWVLLMHHR